MRRLATLLLTLVPGAALAADGDIASQYRSGDWQVVEFLLCDGDHTGPDTECAQLDLHTLWGMPRYGVVEIRTDNCTTTNEGSLVGRSVSGGPAEYVLSGATVLEIGTAVEHAVVEPISHRFLRFDITTFGSTGTCNDFEVIFRAFFERVSGG